MTKSLLDLMPEEERKKAIERGKRRLQSKKYGVKISPEIYLTAEFGYYYGWEAIKAIRDNEITLDEVNVLIEGARKVWYTKLVENGHASLAANIASHSKTPGSSFGTNMRPFMERIEK